ncbi:hypothetical protein [uncultured Hoeflea sp.]|uniref:hypothetical protein n=1 Tax=uncultured Hoeflea sp. TaxID=538666 RepID=UPI0026157F6D|nr:hypothetical protein [uncultured Hoeflea sp.]
MYIRSKDWSAADNKIKGRLLEYVRQKDDAEKGINRKELLSDTIGLGFYPKFSLVRMRASSWEPMNLIWYFLISDVEIIRLNGTSPAIHKANEEGALSLSLDNCLDYLKFFCFFVRGDDGPFLVVTSINEEYFPKSIDETWREKIKKYIIEPKIRYVDEDKKYCIKTNVFYSNSLFESKFSVYETGMVEMDDDDEVVSDVPFEINAPIR